MKRIHPVTFTLGNCDIVYDVMSFKMAQRFHRNIVHRLWSSYRPLITVWTIEMLKNLSILVGIQRGIDEH